MIFWKGLCHVSLFPVPVFVSVFYLRSYHKGKVNKSSRKIKAMTQYCELLFEKI